MKKISLLMIMLFSMVSCSGDKAEPSDMAMEVRDYAEQTLYDFGKDQAVYLWSAKLWADNRNTQLEYV